MQYFTILVEMQRVRTETPVVYSALSSDNGECHKRFSVVIMKHIFHTLTRRDKGITLVDHTRSLVAHLLVIATHELPNAADEFTTD